MTLAAKATSPLLKQMILLAIQLNIFLAFKDKSVLMWFANRVARLFNPRFMTDYHTTSGSTVYIISEEHALERQESTAKVMAHEYTHIHDRRRVNTWLYSAGYLFPQILALPALGHLLVGFLFSFPMPNRVLAWVGLVTGLATAATLGAVFIGTWTLILFAFIAFLAPLPAPWRTKWELRGYMMSLAMNYWRYGSIRDESMDWIEKQFTGPGYYFMWPFKKSARKKLEKAATAVTSGVVLLDPFFKLVYEAVQASRKEAD